MVPANEALFSDPAQYDKIKLLAHGWDGRRTVGGMTDVTEDKVRAGEHLYRVGHSNKSTTINMTSPWWLREESFLYLAGVAEDSGTDLHQLFRMKCAVAYRFGCADLVMKVRLKQTLRAFTGRGRPVFEMDSGGQELGRCWFGSLEIAQLFIPGLRNIDGSMPHPKQHPYVELIDTFDISGFIRVRRNRLMRG